MQLGLLITQRCNAACRHCTTSCGPDKEQALARDEIFGLMDQAAALTDGEPLVFSLSGGEPFLDFELLLAIVAHGAALGGEVTCVTNGYWATSDDKARAMLTALRQAGLRRLGVSTSSFHQRFVKLARAKRALATAAALGIQAVLKYARVRGDDDVVADIESWARDAGVTRVEAFPVLPYLRDGARLQDEQYIVQPGLPQGPCPMPSLTLREDGTAYSCCAPGGFVEPLSLGNAVDEGLAVTYRRFLLNGRQHALRERGPGFFAAAAAAEGLGDRLRPSYVDVCDLCAHVAADPQLNAAAERAARDYEERYLADAIGRLVNQRPQPGGHDHVDNKAGGKEQVRESNHDREQARPV